MQDILDAIAKVEGEQAKGREAFEASRLIQAWMVHHLMIIGEAVRSIDPALRQNAHCVSIVRTVSPDSVCAWDQDVAQAGSQRGQRFHDGAPSARSFHLVHLLRGDGLQRVEVASQMLADQEA